MEVGTWMTCDPETIDSRDTLALAQEKMSRGKFRRLPVTDATGKPIGILAESDLRQHAGYLATTHVDAAMTENPITIGPGEPIEAAAALMLDRKIGGLPVVAGDGKLVGIITETDLLRGLLQGLSGGEDNTGRIDFEFSGQRQMFAAAVEAVERAGGVVLGLGTLRSSERPGETRMYYLRVLAHDLAPLAAALERDGYRVRAVHPPLTGCAPQPGSSAR